MRVGNRTPRSTPDRGEVEVFPTGSTLSREPPSDLPVPDEHDEHHSFHARPGHRPGGCPGTDSARAGGGSDIVRPLLVAPRAASRIVLSGEVFALPLPHLRIEGDRDGADLLVWTVVVVGDHLRPTPATLHVLGSPSMVVTVLELVPARRLRWARERFVRYGVEAIDELAHRIERAA